MYLVDDPKLYDLLYNRRGGPTSILIIDILLEDPKNINRISKKLNLNNKTVEYHLKMFYDNDYLIRKEKKYGHIYLPSEKLINNLDEYYQIKEAILKRDDNNEK